ncbi:MAG: hypothetical protein ACM3NQ_16210 [Bacteroidales bacterium]
MTKTILITTACVGAGYAVLRSPRLRTIAWRLLKVTLTTTIPGIVLKEATEAWREAGKQAA